MGPPGKLPIRPPLWVKGPDRTAERIGVSTSVQCPGCGAAVRPDAAWCTLCYTSLRADFDPLTAPIDEVLGQIEPNPPSRTNETSESIAAVPTDSVAETELATRVDEVDSTRAELSDVDVMLAMLAAEHRQTEKAAELAEQLSDKGTRTMVMIGGTVVIALVLFVLLLVAGMFA